jgi:hypothetical protein
MTVREQGSSNKLFYYTRTGPYTTFNMRVEIALKQQVQVKKWALCVEEVLKVFPEFAVRPVIRDNRIFYEENHAAAPVFTDARIRAFGTEDTNGYLFYNLIDGERIRVSFFHGLCDGVGMESFMDCVLYLYGSRSGLLKEEDSIPTIYKERFGEDCPGTLEMLSDKALDPYGFLAKESGLVSDQAALTEDAFFIPRQKDLVQSGRVHVYSVQTETGAFLALSKKMEVSFTALLIPLVGQAIARGCRVQEETVRIMMPVNLRQIYDVKTVVNFSDGISFALDEALRGEPLAVQAGQCRKRLRELASREYFDMILSGNVKTVQEFEAKEIPAEQVGPRPFVSPAEGMRPPFTCPLTYPRRNQEFSFLSEVSYCCVVPSSLTVVVYVWQDQMTIRCIQKSDSDAIVRALAECLEEAGLRAGIRDEGYLEGDVLLMSRITKR